MATITQEENNGFRVIKALNLCGRRVLHHVFCWGTPDKDSSTKLDDYLNNLNQTSSANFLKLPSKDKKFNKTQKKLINMSPDGTGFDVPLLCLSIKLGCENVASVNDSIWITPSTEMEYYITAVKNMRNDVLHSHLAVPDKKYFENIRKLREVLTGCLKSSGERYKKDEAEVDKEIKQMKDDLDSIMDEILGMEDIVKFCSDDIKQLIITDSCNKLKEILQKNSYINPFSYITDNFLVKVDKIFIDIQVKQGKRRGKGEYKDYRDLLQLIQTTSVSSSINSARPQTLLLEGLAGSGKTTLVKLITEEWIKGGQGTMRGLDDYDLLLWVQCRDHTMNSYQDLLDRLIPDVSTKFRMFLPRIMKLCKVLIIVDGLDELNDHSRSLVKSLFYEFQNSIYTTFICTSRPEKVEIFSMTIPEGYYVTNAELQGIKREHMPEFVRSTHKIIKQNRNSNISIDLLVEKVMSVTDLYEHLRMPMNLAFFVYIWEYEPDEINVMTITQTQLYHKIHELCQKKLLERLAECSETKALNNKDLQLRVQEILRVIYVTSLENLSREQLSLQEETVEQLISACNKHDLPYNEIISAFLSMKSVWTWQGIEEQYSVPHKGIQDYFSALHCVMTLKDQLESSTHSVSFIQNTTQPLLSQPLDTTDSPSQTPLTLVSSKLPGISPPTPATPISLREVLTQSVGTASIDMTKYYNVLLHVAGLLHQLLDQVPEVTTQEVVKLLHESGMTEKNMWLNLLQNTRCSDNIAKAIAPFCNNNYVCIDDKHVESYKVLLPYTKRSEVNIVITGNFGEVPGLIDLIKVVSLYHHRCTRLHLDYHYYQYDTTTSDDFLQILQPRSYLMSFMGRLSAAGVSLLPPSLTQLNLCVVSDDHARSLLPQLHQVVTSNLLHLQYFGVRIPGGVSPAALMSLPKSEKVNLTLTDVSDTCIGDACDVIQTLQPPGGYWDIAFTSWTATVVGIQDMIRGLADRSVKVNCLTVNTVITKQQEHELVTMANSTIQCRLTVFDTSTAVGKTIFD